MNSIDHSNNNGNSNKQAMPHDWNRGADVALHQNGKDLKKRRRVINRWVNLFYTKICYKNKIILELLGGQIYSICSTL